MSSWPSSLLQAICGVGWPLAWQTSVVFSPSCTQENKYVSRFQCKYSDDKVYKAFHGYYPTFVLIHFWEMCHTTELLRLSWRNMQTGGSQRDIVFLGWPKAPSFMSPAQMRGGGAGSQKRVQLCTWSPNKHRRSYSIYNLWCRQIWRIYWMSLKDLWWLQTNTCNCILLYSTWYMNM